MSGNAVVTEEECETGIDCDLPISTCPEPATTGPVTESPTTVTDDNGHDNGHVTFDPAITITTSGTKLKAFGTIMAVLVMLI